MMMKAWTTKRMGRGLPVRGLLMILALAQVPLAQAADEGGVSFSRNRLIYPAGDKAISLTVTNHGSRAYLVQAGVSANVEHRTAAPFVVTPPLFRLEGNSDNVMRIMGTGAALPQDRESVFWFFASTIPGRDTPGAAGDAAGNAGMSATLSISMKTVLKLFWRPKGLAMKPQDAPALLRFVHNGKDMVVKNPTPYYQSFAFLTLDGQAQNLDSGPSMVAPFSELRFAGKGAARQVTWQVMNDYGGTTDKKSQPIQ